MPRGAGVHPRCSETVSGSPWNGSPSAHSKSTPASGPGATIVSAVPATKARRELAATRGRLRASLHVGRRLSRVEVPSRAAQLRRTRGLSTVQPQLACWAREQHAGQQWRGDSRRNSAARPVLRKRRSQCRSCRIQKPASRRPAVSGSRSGRFGEGRRRCRRRRPISSGKSSIPQARRRLRGVPALLAEQKNRF